MNSKHVESVFPIDSAALARMWAEGQNPGFMDGTRIAFHQIRPIWTMLAEELLLRHGEIL